MTETSMKRSGGRRRRRILIFTLVAILMFFMVRAGVDLWAGHRVDVAVSHLEKLHGSLDERTLNVPLVPAGENRARAIRAAAALIDFAPLTGRDNQASVSRFLALRAPAPVPADLRAFVEANRAALQVADDARARRQSNWEADYTRGSNSPGWLDIRTLSNAIYLAARLDLEAGRADEAAREIASGLALSASVRQEPGLIAQLLRCAFGMQHFEAVQRLVIQSEPSKASLEEISRWLTENRTPDPARVGLLSELKHVNAALTRMESGSVVAYGETADLLPHEVARMTGAYDSPFWLGPLARLARPLIRLARVRYLEQMGHLLDLQTGPRPRPPSTAAPARRSWMKRLDTLSIAGLERTMDTSDLFMSELGVTELAIALRRFRLDHGQYPDALSALVPTYVASVPSDPLTGTPPVYARQGAGFRLHAENAKNVSALTAAALDWTVPK
jgi:hypothetical protein